MRKHQLLLTVLLTSNVYVGGFTVTQNCRKGCMSTKLNVAAAETISELKVQTDISNELTPEQENFFVSLDVQVYGIHFIERARDLQKFKNEFGSCRVPKRYAANPTLGNWVNKTRQMYRKHLNGESTSLTKDRIQLLNDIGFVWSGMITSSTSQSSQEMNLEIPSTTQQQNREKSWKNSFQDLSNILKEDRERSLPKKLSVWAARQRREYQKYEMGEKAAITKERIEMLNSIEFDWNPWESKWNMRVDDLIKYKRANGDCLVPVNYEKNLKLGRWVSTQRKYYRLYQEGKPTRISEERIKQLSDIGFVWNRWDEIWNID